MSTPGQQVTANMLLCDAAQVVVDKLYILGGGWSYIWLVNPEQPFGFMVAIDLAIPWDFANRQLNIVVEILTEDRADFTPANYDGPARAEGTLVAGRSPTARAGTDLHSALVIPFAPMLLEPGGYVCELTVGGVPVNRAPFQVAIPGQAS